ncbi:unnamed protein product [Pedinophyceae sp. YPF-701]|nr:unnamed protein product [Pedinophyceae sp. YPF-701]
MLPRLAQQPAPLSDVATDNDGSAIVPVDAWLSAHAKADDFPGIFACYDSQKSLQYVGHSDAVIRAVCDTWERTEDVLAYVRVQAIKNHAMATESVRESQARAWINEAGTTPPGNGTDKRIWMGPSEYLSDTEVEGAEPEERPRVSPFLQAAAHRSIANDASDDEAPVLTADAADEVLEEVRPFLLADGGDVEVVKVQDGNVYVEMQGNCGSCSSSEATLRMGIERALRSRFGDQLREVIQVATEDLGTSADGVNAHLDGLRPAIKAYGGEVRVLEVLEGRCTVLYTGPVTIAAGIRAAVKDRFPDIVEVVFQDESGAPVEVK